jgi:hypothetical protein
MSMGQIPKKNKYAEKLEEDLNFTTRFGESHSAVRYLWCVPVGDDIPTIIPVLQHFVSGDNHVTT